MVIPAMNLGKPAKAARRRLDQAGGLNFASNIDFSDDESWVFFCGGQVD
jgi:hypothetical protein